MSDPKKLIPNKALHLQIAEITAVSVGATRGGPCSVTVKTVDDEYLMLTIKEPQWRGLLKEVQSVADYTDRKGEWSDDKK